MQRLGSQLIIIIMITESNCVYSSSCSNNNKLKCRCTARLFITTNAIIIIYPCKLGWRRGGGDGVFNSNEVNSAGKSVTTSLQQNEALPCSPPASDGSSSNRYSLPENNFFVSPTTTTFLSSTDHIFRSNYRHQNYISRVAF